MFPPSASTPRLSRSSSPVAPPRRDPLAHVRVFFKDLASLIGPEQSWMTTEQFFEAIRQNLETEMASWA